MQQNGYFILTFIKEFTDDFQGLNWGLPSTRIFSLEAWLINMI